MTTTQQQKYTINIQPVGGRVSHMRGTAYTAQLRQHSADDKHCVHIDAALMAFVFQFGNDQDRHLFARTVSISVADTNSNRNATDTSNNHSDFFSFFNSI